MVNIPISSLPAATTVSGTDVLPIVQGGVTKKANASLLPISASAQVAMDARGLMANAIFNGDMAIYQDTSSIASLTHLDKCHDRWIYGQQGAGSVMSWDRDTDVPDNSVSASSKFTTVTGSAVTSTQEKHVRYAIEGSDFLIFRDRMATLSFWVKGSTTGTYSVAFTNSGRNRTYVANYTINVAATWEEKVIVVNFGDAGASGGTWDYGNGQGIGIRFAMTVGSTYQGTVNTWNAANVTGTAQVDLGSTAGRYIKFAKVQLNMGATKTPYFHRSITETFQLVTRYLYVVTDAMMRRSSVSSVTTASVVEIYYSLPSRLRALPTVSIGGTRGTDWMLRYRQDTSNGTGTLLSTPAYGRDAGLVRFETGTYTAGDDLHLLLATATGRVTFDAEL